MTTPIAPSGQQIEIALADRRAVIVEVGGGVRSYTVGGRERLNAYAVDEISASGRGQVLLPWPNRIQGGAYEFEGTQYQLALTEPTAGNAIHGLVRWATWTVVEHEAGRAVMGYVLHPQTGYPFSLEVSIEYVLSETGLRVHTTATNIGPDACPFGSGAHPYLTVGTPTVDTTILRLPAQAVLRADEHGMPNGSDPVAGTEYDFREPRAIGTIKLDTAFGELERDHDGLARVELRDPAGTGTTLWVDESYRYLMLFTGDTRPDVARRAIAVEPMTCPPNAFRSGDDLIVLEPGESWHGAWGID